MTLKTNVFAAVASPTSQNTAFDQDGLSKVTGTAAEIAASAPPTEAIGFASDAADPLHFVPGRGWNTRTAATSLAGTETVNIVTAAGLPKKSSIILINAYVEYYATAAARNAVYPTGGLSTDHVIWMANPAVPGGRSRLRWNGSLWVPPCGELIAFEEGSASTPLADVTPGTISTLTSIYDGTIIPDHMLPEGVGLRTTAKMACNDPTTAGTPLMYAQIKGQACTATDRYRSPHNFNAAITASTTWFGDQQTCFSDSWREGANIYGDIDQAVLKGGSPGYATKTYVGSYLTGATRMRFAAYMHSVTCRMQVYSYSIVSRGRI